MRYLIKVSYDGSKFFGFQRQNDKLTVQGELEKVLTIINKKEVLLKGAGRTDAGVHAYGQMAHFDLDVPVPPERLKNAMNSILNDYVSVKDCKIVDDDFHARFQVQSKKYVYKIWLGEYDPLKFDYYLFYDKPIHIKKLQECASIFIGKHSFHNFVSGERDCYDGTIFDISFVQKENSLEIIFKGKSFYRYMVRNLVGAMLCYNEGKCELSLLERMIEDIDFCYTLSTAKANGLYLEDVDYES